MTTNTKAEYQGDSLVCRMSQMLRVVNYSSKKLAHNIDCRKYVSISIKIYYRWKKEQCVYQRKPEKKNVCRNNVWINGGDSVLRSELNDSALWDLGAKAGLHCRFSSCSLLHNTHWVCGILHPIELISLLPVAGGALIHIANLLL